MLLQPPSKCRHYSQAYRTHHSTEPSYEPLQHYYHLATFLTLPPHLRHPSLLYLVHPIQQVTL